MNIPKPTIIRCDKCGEMLGYFEGTLIPEITRAYCRYCDPPGPDD